MTVDPAQEEAPSPSATPDGATHRIHLPHVPKFKPSKLLMPVLTGLGLWLVVEQLLGLGEIRGVFDDGNPTRDGWVSLEVDPVTDAPWLTSPTKPPA